MHHSKKRKLSLKTDQRRSLLKGLANNLILKEKIKTTIAKAKELRPFIERLVTKSRKNNLAAIKYIAKYLPEKSRKKLIHQITPFYLNRPGGYTRIIRISPRKKDSAKMAIIEFVK